MSGNRAGRFLARAPEGVGAPCGAGGRRTCCHFPNKFTNLVPGRQVVRGLVTFKHPLLLRSIKLPEIIDACIRRIMSLLAAGYQSDQDQDKDERADGYSRSIADGWL